jgi:hypothetical protein
MGRTECTAPFLLDERVMIPALNALQFGLSETAIRKPDKQFIDAGAENGYR